MQNASANVCGTTGRCEELSEFQPQPSLLNPVEHSVEQQRHVWSDNSGFCLDLAVARGTVLAYLAVPAGSHVRLNLQTGEREVRLGEEQLKYWTQEHRWELELVVLLHPVF
uniref:Uncharacterized protein n=1 Tax=Fundulus heteroclitus TaxID=8078 RepID=A0A3Q2SZ94_FUNHE